MRRWEEEIQNFNASFVWASQIISLRPAAYAIAGISDTTSRKIIIKNDFYIFESINTWRFEICYDDLIISIEFHRKQKSCFRSYLAIYLQTSEIRKYFSISLHTERKIFHLMIYFYSISFFLSYIWQIVVHYQIYQWSDQTSIKWCPVSRICIFLIEDFWQKEIIRSSFFFNIVKIKQRSNSYDTHNRIKSLCVKISWEWDLQSREYIDTVVIGRLIEELIMMDHVSFVHTWF